MVFGSAVGAADLTTNASTSSGIHPYGDLNTSKRQENLLDSLRIYGLEKLHVKLDWRLRMASSRRGDHHLLSRAD